MGQAGFSLYSVKAARILISADSPSGKENTEPEPTLNGRGIPSTYVGENVAPKYLLTQYRDAEPSRLCYQN